MIKGVKILRAYILVTYKKALVFNPYVMHGSHLLPPSSTNRFTVVIRMHADDNLDQSYRGEKIKRDTAKCFSKLFQNDNETIYKSLLNNGDLGVSSFSWPQLEAGLVELQHHYDASKTYFSRERYAFCDAAKQSIDAYIDNMGIDLLNKELHKDDA